MEKRASFQDYAIVACGTLNMEMNHLRDTGFLDKELTHGLLYSIYDINEA